jgi:mycofactocin precursor
VAVDSVTTPDDPADVVVTEIGSADDTEVLEDVLVEEISIDGMCGVY